MPKAAFHTVLVTRPRLSSPRHGLLFRLWLADAAQLSLAGSVVLVGHGASWRLGPRMEPPPVPDITPRLRGAAPAVYLPVTRRVPTGLVRGPHRR